MLKYGTLLTPYAHKLRNRMTFFRLSAVYSTGNKMNYDMRKRSAEVSSVTTHRLIKSAKHKAKRDTAIPLSGAIVHQTEKLRRLL